MALNPATSTSAVLTLFACSVLAQTPIDFGDDSSTWANDDEVTGGRVERGRLEAGDSTLVSGEYEDVYSFEATNGGDVVIDVRSEAFDTYLMLRTPSGDQVENDDHEGDASRSLIALRLDEGRTYEVTVTSYQPGEMGDYTLLIDVVGESLVAQTGPWRTPVELP